MAVRVLVFFTIILISLPLQAKSILDMNNNELLSRLDYIIKNKQKYQKNVQLKIDSLKQNLKQASPQKRFEIYHSLFSTYLHQQTDSAFYYIEKMEQSEYLKTNNSKINLIYLYYAEAYGLRGLFFEAQNSLNKIDIIALSKTERNNYFHTYRSINGWFADFVDLKKVKKHYSQLVKNSRDSILKNSLPGINRDIVLADKYNSLNKPKKALALMNKYLSKVSNRQQAYVFYTMAMSYKILKDIEQEKRFLALTAISDLKTGTREYLALPSLAQLLFEEGDVRRAYSYMECSLEDANYCKAGFRYSGISKVFSIINYAYKKEIATRDKVYLGFNIIGLLFSIALIIGVLQLRKQKRNLSSIRVELRQANDNLHKINSELVEAGKIKEEYITRYLNISRNYLNKFNDYHRNLQKLAHTTQIDNLYKVLKSDKLINEETKLFFKQFDESFLTLFPHFVDDFNNLLIPKARIKPKKGELLNTELRIFALIRLGIADSTRISEFLGYSITTVYNYRSRIHNKAIGDKADFENKVMQL